MKKFIAALILLFPVTSWGAIYYASPTGEGTTCSEASPCALKYTIETKASASDTVSASSGTYTVDSGITINKALTLIGAGYSSTVFNIGATPALTITSDTVTISGINFDSSGYLAENAQTLRIDNTSESQWANIIIKNNKFNQSHDAIYRRGWISGVVFNNVFLNCERACMMTGGSADENASWSRTIAAGTSDALFIESNTFTYDSDFPTAAYGSGPEQAIYHQQGARTVVRYNTVDSTAFTSSGYNFYDTHPNWGSSTAIDFRGQPIGEVYNNDVKVYSVSSAFVYLRGGSTLVHDNAFSYSSGSTDKIVVFVEDEEWSSGSTMPTDSWDTTWPCTDQIYSTFVWNNTLNGSASSNVAIHSNNLAISNPNNIIQADRDYWLAAPAASGGKITFGGAAGISNSACTAEATPTACCTGDKTGTCDMTFSAEGANAYYPYTPYTCPHPLVGVGSCDSATAGTGGYTLGNAKLGTGSAVKLGTGAAVKLQ